MQANRENFRAISGYDNYEISTHGRVRNVKNGKILKPRYDSRGYLYVGLYKTGEKPKNFTIHKLVATTFIPNPDNLPTVDHRNKSKSDNRAENLRWATRTTQAINRKKRRTNKSGTIGVCFDKRLNRYMATWREDGKLKQKCFYVSKLGDDEAKKKAIEFRQQMIASIDAYTTAL